MQLSTDILKKVEEFASENATTLLTAAGVVGTVATAVLAGRAGYKSAEILREANERKKTASMLKKDPPVEKADFNVPAENMLSKTEKATLVGLHFVPPVITGAATITCIIMSNRMSAQKAAALAAAYGLSQKQFEEYRAKVAEKLTGPKKSQIDEELAQERANQTPGSGQFIIVEGGDVLCFDQPTGRYFKSTMEKIQRATNKTNEEIIHGDHAPANFFYQELGLPDTTWGDHVGWNSDNLVELEITTILSPEDQSTPVLAIDFKRLPTESYMRKDYL